MIEFHDSEKIKAAMDKQTRAEKIEALKRYFFVSLRITRPRFFIFKKTIPYETAFYTVSGKYFNKQMLFYKILETLNIKTASFSILNIIEMKKSDYAEFTLTVSKNGKSINRQGVPNGSTENNK